MSRQRSRTSSEDLSQSSSVNQPSFPTGVTRAAVLAPPSRNHRQSKARVRRRPCPLKWRGYGDSEPPMATVESNFSGGPRQDSGMPLLRPAEESEALRRRRERPAEMGRTLLLLLGVICAGASTALWVTDRSVISLGLLAFGSLLVGLGLVEHLLIGRDRKYHVDQALLWATGIELLLHNEEIRAASWTDAKLALDIFVHPRRGNLDEDRILVWRMDSRVPPCDLSEDGLEHLKGAVVTHGLRLREFRGGRKTRESHAYEIRPGRPHIDLTLASQETVYPVD